MYQTISIENTSYQNNQTVQINIKIFIKVLSKIQVHSFCVIFSKYFRQYILYIIISTFSVF